jgi:hypothetical protein
VVGFASRGQLAPHFLAPLVGVLKARQILVRSGGERQDLMHRSAILPLQPVKQRQTFLHFVEACGIYLESA